MTEFVSVTISEAADLQEPYVACLQITTPREGDSKPMIELFVRPGYDVGTPARVATDAARDSPHLRHRPG